MRRTKPLRWLVLFAALAVLAAPTVASARAWLGVYTQEVTSDLRDALDLPDYGVLVARIVPGSPAERMGLKKGDVILSVDRHDVNSPAELSDVIGDAREGESVAITFSRGGDRRTLSVRLDSRPDDSGDEDRVAPVPPVPDVAPVPRMAPAPRAPKAPAEPKRTLRWYSSDGPDSKELQEHLGRLGTDFDLPGLMAMSGRGRLGVRIQSLSEDLASALGASGSKGVLVLEVLEDTPAQKAGLRAGDIITRVGDERVDDADDLVQALRGENGRTQLTVVRRGQVRTVGVELEDSPRVLRLRDGNRTFVGPGRQGDDQKFEVRLKGEADDEGLRQQLDELRDEVRALRKEIQERR